MVSRQARSIEQLVEEDYAVDIGYYVNRGLEVFQQELGPLVGFNLLSCLISIAVAVVPAVGGVLNQVISSPLAAGYWIYLFKSFRRQEPTFGDFFKGFNYWLAMVVVPLLISFFLLLLILPFLILTMVQLVGIFAPLIRGEVDPEAFSNEDILLQFLPWLIFIILVILVFSMGLRVIYIFAYPLILDRKLEFWPAMETSRRLVAKRWGRILGLVLVADLINVIGALFLLVGMIFTVPLSFCILGVAYEDIVGLEAESY